MSDADEFDAERSKAVQRRLYWVACPTCRAPEGVGCSARNSGHPTTPHRTRITAAEKAVDADRAKSQTGRIRWTDGTLKGFVDDVEAFQVHDVRHAGKGWWLRARATTAALTSHPTLDEAKAAAERTLDQSDEK
jgi:hypothetical protein